MKHNADQGINSKELTEIANLLTSDEAIERTECLNVVEHLLAGGNIKEPQYRRIWKALIYGLWATDKMQPQIEVSMKISKYVHVFASGSSEEALNWIKAGFEIFHKEWDNIDYNRRNKFLSLARFCLDEVYHFLENKSWNGKLVKEWNQILLDEVLGGKLGTEGSYGLVMHFLQVFVETLLGLKTIPYIALKTLLDPLIELLIISKDKKVRENTVKYVFRPFVTDISKFEDFDPQKYAGYLLKRASAKDLDNTSRGILYKVQKIFLDYVAPENPYQMELDINDDEELADEGISMGEIKKGRPGNQHKNGEMLAEDGKKKTKGEKKKARKEAKKQGLLLKLQEEKEKEEQKQAPKKKENKLNQKIKTKEDVKNKRNNVIQQKEAPKKKNLRSADTMEEEVDEDADNEENDWIDEDGDEDDFEEEVPVKGKKGVAAKKAAPGKSSPVPVKNGKRKFEEIEEDEPEDAPEGWELEEEGDFVDEDSEEEPEYSDEDEVLEMIKNQSSQSKIPIALLLTPKLQKAYFSKINNQYYDNLKTARKKDIKRNKQLTFNIKNNIVREFDKRHTVPNKQAPKLNKVPGKGILRKSIYISATPAGTKAVKVAGKTNNNINNKKNNSGNSAKARNNKNNQKNKNKRVKI